MKFEFYIRLGKEYIYKLNFVFSFFIYVNKDDFYWLVYFVFFLGEKCLVFLSFFYVVCLKLEKYFLLG